jgi:hypothetical protein
VSGFGLTFVCVALGECKGYGWVSEGGVREGGQVAADLNVHRLLLLLQDAASSSSGSNTAAAMRLVSQGQLLAQLRRPPSDHKSSDRACVLSARMRPLYDGRPQLGMQSNSCKQLQGATQTVCVTHQSL